MRNRKLQTINHKLKGGFTFLELLIVFAVLFILATIVVYAASNFKKQALLTEAKTKALAELNLARSQTLGSEAKNNYGLHFESGKIVRFRGQSYSASDPLNEEILLPPGVLINAVSLGGPVDIIFERLTGRASAAGTVTFQLASDDSKTAVITIYSSGAAE